MEQQHSSKPTPKSNDNTGMEVAVYFGGVKFRDEYLADHIHGTHKSKSQLIAMEFMLFPITFEKIVSLVSDVLPKSNMYCTFSDNHIITLQTVEMVPSSATKKGASDVCMNKCIPVPLSLNIKSRDAYKGPKLCVVVHDKNQPACSSSYSGGSDCVNTHHNPRTFAIDNWASKLCVSFFTGDKHAFPKHIEFAFTKHEEFKAAMCVLADVLLQHSTSLPPAPKVEDYMDTLQSEFLAIDYNLDLPAGITFTDKPNAPEKKCESRILSPSLIDEFLLELSNNSTDDQHALLKCRLRDVVDCPVLSVSVSSLANSRFLLDVITTCDCGKDSHLKVGTWCALEKVLVDRGGLLVTPPGTIASILLRLKHFYTTQAPLCDMKFDSDTED